jgi:ribosomal protein S18 acetylase RimI-like enzyme
VGLIVREAQPADRNAIHEALIACGAFTEEEIRVALEILDLGLVGGPEGDYPVFVAEADGRICGYVCLGRTPLTVSTWHLYWICVHPAAKRTGIGRALQEYAEFFVRSRGGQRVVLETSGKSNYSPAHAFYRRAGYTVVGRIPDFYKPGDDCLVYCKTLSDVIPPTAPNGGPLPGSGTRSD